MAASLDRRDGAISVQLQGTCLNRVLRDLLPHQRIRASAELACALGQLRRCDLRSCGQGQAERAAFVEEGCHRDGPPVARFAEDLRLRHLHVLEEDLVELGVTSDLDQRADLDARALHVDQEIGQTLAWVGFLALAGEEHAPPRHMGERRPDLLAVDDVVIAFVIGARLEP